MNQKPVERSHVSVPATLERLLLREGPISLEEMLLALAKYGKPRISHDGSGWYCAIEMYVSSSGVDFKVASEFGCSSPMAAALQCASRLDKAIKDIGA